MILFRIIIQTHIIANGTYYIYVANIKIFKKQLSCFFSCHKNKRQSDASDCFPLLLILYKSILKLYFVLKMICRARLWLLLKVQKWFWKINFSVWYIFLEITFGKSDFKANFEK